MTPSDAKMIVDLDAAEALATKGPWCVFKSGIGRTEKEFQCPQVSRIEEFGSMDYATRECVLDFWASSSERWDADAAFIAVARNALPRLLALVREQDAALRLAEARPTLQQARAWCEEVQRNAEGWTVGDSFIPWAPVSLLAALGKAVTP